MDSRLQISFLDILAFALYFLVIVAVGVILARRKKVDSKDFFLARNRLPWYAIGASIIASNISTEHFIGMVGWAYIYGIAVANWEWGNWFTFTLLIWVFLPFYLRGGLYTMPEFLERRFNAESRYIFAGLTTAQYVLAMMAVVLYAGAMALQGMFGVPVVMGIFLLGGAAGIYTVWGGLFSAVWIEFIQFMVLMGSGLLVTILALDKAGGIGRLMEELPGKFEIFLPPTHEMIPWTGMFGALLSIGVWYNCTNQFIVQRCLGARTEWDGRMGVVFAGFAKVLLPVVLVIPGIVAFRLYQGELGQQGDLAFPVLVRHLLGPGLVGIVMAGLAAAIMSTVSSALNSTSTVFTMDLYRPLLRRDASETHLIRVGRVCGVGALLMAIGIAVWISYRPNLTVFGLIQNIGAWIAAPVSAVFLCGIFSRRATGAASTFILLFGFPFTWFVDSILFTQISWLVPYANFLHRTFVVWLVSILVIMVVSFLDKRRGLLGGAFLGLYAALFTWSLVVLVRDQAASAVPAVVVAGLGLLFGYLCWIALGHSATPPPAVVEEIVWKPSRLRFRAGEQGRGLASLVFWWALFVSMILALYVALVVFQWNH